VIDTPMSAFAAGLRDEAHELELGRSPYEEREREPGPSEPDPRRQAAQLRQTAAMLRRLAQRSPAGDFRRRVEEDAAQHEAQADRLESAPYMWSAAEQKFETSR